MPLTQVFTIGRDAELRHTQSGMPVCNLSLAYNYGQKEQANGRKPTQWLDAAFFGKRAESLAPHLLKGVKIFATVEDIHIETFSRADGTPAVKLAGSVLHLDFAGPPANSAAPAPAPRPAPAPPPRPAPVKTGFDDMDSDDIPF